MTGPVRKNRNKQDLVPTIQADEIIQFLTIGGIARSSGVRIWSAPGIQKMNVPAATGVPSWVWMSQNSIQSATDANLSQLAFDLKERRALVAIPNQLLAVSVPGLDVLLGELLGKGAAEHEDTAFFNTTTVSGGPTALFAAADITMVNCAGSANGGNLAYSDLLGCLATMIANKGSGNFAWIFSPRTFYNRVLGMTDGQSRPIVIPTFSQGLYGKIQYTLLGFNVYVTPFLLENEALGSGSNQAHAIFFNPSYAHICQNSNLELAISTERFFDASQTAIRGTMHEDFGYSPAQGIICLRGIN